MPSEEKLLIVLSSPHSQLHQLEKPGPLKIYMNVHVLFVINSLEIQCMNIVTVQNFGPSILLAETQTQLPRYDLNYYLLHLSDEIEQVCLFGAFYLLSSKLLLSSRPDL